MAINYNYVSQLESMVDSMLGINITNGELTEQDINYALTMCRMLVPGVSDEDVEETRKNLQYKHMINAGQGVSLLDDYDEKWYDDVKSNIEPKFWNRYREYLINDKKFSPNVVNVLGNETLDRDVMNCIGNPNSKEDFFKRGLIIGDVQSGKTSTYIGLMCKAADAGYKVFILLTGTIESLRKQTQERVEEGFIGIDMSATKGASLVRVGVGLDNKPIMATSMTSRSSDFTGKSDEIAMTLSHHDAVVFVIKKNKTVLTKLINWLKNLNADPMTGRINQPMLLIDDEADNASVNTRNKEEDPATINKLIRELSQMFTRSNYIGFTATPYANVFIDPVTTDDMENHDLFPESFIYALPTPSDYIGAQQIFSKDGKYHNQLRYITDAGNIEDDGWSFYFKHKKEWDGYLPDSLTDAIYTFLLANAIRDLKGKVATHRSMMINISRYVAVQYKIKEKVQSIYDEVYRSIKFNLDPDDMDESLKDPIIRKLYGIWGKEYAENCGVTWNAVASQLFTAIDPIVIKIVNSSKSSEKLVYDNNNPLRVIAIGGLALSRGLTLEGLTVSYFYRNTATYDVLMQMGRWFGYRKGYETLFRIWTHESSSRWYGEISDATELLKHDMREMHERNLKPKNFGIRVRNDCDELSITSRNKMRSTADSVRYVSFSGDIFETPYLVSDIEKNRQNYIRIYNYLREKMNKGVSLSPAKESDQQYLLRDIPKGEIINLLKKMNLSKYNVRFDKFQIISYLETEENSYIDKWDIAFMNGKGYAITLGGQTINTLVRTGCQIENDILKIGRRGRLGGPTDGKIGITDEQKSQAIELFKSDYESKNGSPFDDGRTYPSDTWFKYITDRNPLLIIYLIEVKKGEHDAESTLLNNYIEGMKFAGESIPSVGLAMGIPRNDSVRATGTEKYKVSGAYNYFELHEDDVEEEGSDE